MSRHYIVLRQASIGTQFAAVDEALEALQRTQPKLAEALRRQDWPAIRQQVAHETIAQVAEKRGIAAKSYAAWRTDGGAQPKGACAGIITVKGTDIALFVADDRIELAWQESHYARDERLSTAVAVAHRATVPAAVTELQRELGEVYRERALATSLHIAAAGQQVHREVRPDGGVVLRVTVKGGA
ncbi:hypothetical protein HY634_04665 [Candidatus Uhrbacteria bacterium]|nr:hypothetical protein [Candidatus Uhrbacteria bacterium]